MVRNVLFMSSTCYWLTADLSHTKNFHGRASVLGPGQRIIWATQDHPAYFHRFNATLLLRLADLDKLLLPAVQYGN